MENKINAGVVVATQFVSSENEVFTGYIDYICRDEAVRNSNTDKYVIDEFKNEYGTYIDYMDNPEKTTGLFTDSKDNLSQEEKQKLKKVFETAKDNESLMWQTVISFDNRWLEENGLYDSKSLILDENKLKECTRGCMKKMLSKENMNESSCWSASIHYNTDNIHVHIATVEPIPTREKIKTGKFAGEYKGKFKQSSIELGKSFVVNNIISQQKENQMINEIIRNNIAGSEVKNLIGTDDKLYEQFLNIREMLPPDKRTWQYNNNKIKHVIPFIDEFSSKYIDEYFKADFEKLKTALKIQEKKYSTAYGSGEKRNNNLYENKMKDLYYRLGNHVLKEIKNYDNEIKKQKYENIKKYRVIKRTSKHKPIFKKYDEYKVFTNYIKRIKECFNKEFESEKNQYIYEQMQNENQINNSK